ncbi:MAG: DUF2911 domain-containing protein [Gemmatimonadota bacterium]
MSLPRFTPLCLTAALAIGLPALTPDAAAQQRSTGGRASPLDSVKAVVGDAHIEIQYGRPSVRGRVIFGGLVPWNRVWRTGANEATGFRTSADLEFGETRIPAGEYTLYTLPSPDGWTLIINEQTGQWGTEYHRDRDLVRLPMKVETLEQPVELFTISVVPGKNGKGALSLSWAGTRAWVDFQAAEKPGGP